MVAFEVPHDRVGPGVEPASGELPAELDDQRDGAAGVARGRVARSS